MLNHSAAPHTRCKFRKFQYDALGVEDEVEVSGQRSRRKTRIDRALIMCVMITRNHHYRHVRTRNLIHGEVERLGTDTARIEQVAHDQQKVGTVAVRDVDYAGKRAAHAITEDIAPRT